MMAMAIPWTIAFIAANVLMLIWLILVNAWRIWRKRTHRAHVALYLAISNPVVGVATFISVGFFFWVWNRPFEPTLLGLVTLLIFIDVWRIWRKLTHSAHLAIYLAISTPVVGVTTSISLGYAWAWVWSRPFAPDLLGVIIFFGLPVLAEMIVCLPIAALADLINDRPYLPNKWPWAIAIILANAPAALAYFWFISSRESAEAQG